MVCSKGFWETNLKRPGRWNSKRPPDSLARAVCPSLGGAVTLWLNSARPVCVCCRNASRLFSPSALAPMALPAITMVMALAMMVAIFFTANSPGGGWMARSLIVIARGHQHFALAAAGQAADQPGFFHVFEQAGRTVVANAQLALHIRDAGLAVLEHHLDGLVVHRVFFAAAPACAAVRRQIRIRVCAATFEHAVDVVRRPLLLEVADDAEHLCVRHEGAMRPDPLARAAGHVEHIHNEQQGFGAHLVEDG